MDDETQISEFCRLYKDMLFLEFMESGIKRGKPSKYILRLSRLMHRIFSEKNMGNKDRRELLESLERDMKKNSKEMLEIMKLKV